MRRISDGTGAMGPPAARNRRRSSAPNHAAASHCAMTVPHAEPRNPQPKPYTNSSSSTRFAAFATARMTSGVRVSERPRS